MSPLFHENLALTAGMAVTTEPSQVDLEKFQADPEAYLGERTLFAAQKLINR